MKLNGFNGEKVIMISCGSHHPFELTECGHVFSWGLVGIIFEQCAKTMILKL
jgi:alpha-tubulin suppressor-like RCC1 family protein